MKLTAISIIVAGALIGGSILYLGISASEGTGSLPDSDNQNNVSMVNGTQIVDVAVKGGYRPKKSVAKAGVPTVLRFSTNGTYDCSTSVRIPSMGISKFLPASGTTDIELGSPKVSVLRGMCGMGMYTFEIDFEA